MVTKSKNRVGGMVEECAQGKFTGLSLFCSNQLELQCGGPSAPVHGESHCGHFSIYELSLALWVWEFKGTHPDQ